MEICKFLHCKNKFVRSTSRRNTKQKLLQVYCKDCTGLFFLDSGTPSIVQSYGNIKAIWKHMMKFAFEFGHDYKLNMFVDPEKFKAPQVDWEPRLQRSDTKTGTLYGLAYIDERHIKIYIRRMPKTQQIFDTVIHELVHIVVYHVFNEPLNVMGGHTKIFWKFFFDFFDYLGADLYLEV